MAVSVFKTFAAGEILTAADLNSSFTQITSNGEDLGWPATKSKDLDGQKLILDSDADSSIGVTTDDRIDLELQGQNLFRFDGTTATSVNGLDFVAAAAGSPATVAINGVGVSTNIDINMVPKGSGVLKVSGTAVPLNTHEDATSIIAQLVFS